LAISQRRADKWEVGVGHWAEGHWHQVANAEWRNRKRGQEWVGDSHSQSMRRQLHLEASVIDFCDSGRELFVDFGFLWRATLLPPQVHGDPIPSWLLSSGSVNKMPNGKRQYPNAQLTHRGRAPLSPIGNFVY